MTRALYPPIEPFDAGYLAVGDGHEIYWEVPFKKYVFYCGEKQT
jgi:hypothetical protein